MKTCIIIPYFGRFNDYFSLWKQSCGNNKDIDWLLFTDQNVTDLPSNIKYFKMNFSEIKVMFENKFKERICLDRPYKLCDFKPYYGYLFSEYIREYDFWGYCDCDVIFGNILSFLDESLFEKYDKILRTGHLSFVRNKKEINENFFKYSTYKMVIHSPVIYGFDESVNGFRLGFAGELMASGYSFFDESKNIADIDFRYFPFYIINQAKIPSVFLFKNKRIFRVTENKESVEMMYIHLQKRKMSVQNDTADSIIIYPNIITSAQEVSLDKEFWEKVTEEQNDYYSFTSERINNLKRDCLRFVYEPWKIKSILYRFQRKGNR